jgi:dienelactone hydrolase
VLFTLGSFAGPADHLGRLFASRGYVFLFLFPRGLGLSANRGENTTDLLANERARRGTKARDRLYVKLLETHHLRDGIAALAFLRSLPEVDSLRVAAAGHSGGASVAMLIAERDKRLRAVVNFAGAARNWEQSPPLRRRLLEAARRGTAPVMMVYAANDASLAPVKALDAEMTVHGRLHRATVYPQFGRTTDDGHRYVFLSTTWVDDVFAFLDKNVRPLAPARPNTR